MDLPFNRALHTDDYPALLPWSRAVLDFESEMRSRGIPFRKDHTHRTWEYANVLRQIDLLFPQQPEGLRVLDAGGGGSSLAPLLATRANRVVVADSMAYGDIREAFTQPQAAFLGLSEHHFVVMTDPVEALRSIPDDTFDLTLCISVIEHVAADQFVNALSELHRVTKPGGYVFITTDFFENVAQADASPFRSIQHTLFTPEFTPTIIYLAPLFFMERDPTGVIYPVLPEFPYRGDFVHNYSFVNLVLGKRKSGLS